MDYPVHFILTTTEKEGVFIIFMSDLDICSAPSPKSQGYYVNELKSVILLICIYKINPMLLYREVMVPI